MFTPIFTEEQFAAALASPRPVVIIWGQPGCPACQDTKPVVRRFATHHQDVDCYEVNVNMLEQLANQQRIQATPTLMIFRRGSRLARRTGELSEEQLERWVVKAVDGDTQRSR